MGADDVPTAVRGPRAPEELYDVLGDAGYSEHDVLSALGVEACDAAGCNWEVLRGQLDGGDQRVAAILGLFALGSTSIGDQRWRCRLRRSRRSWRPGCSRWPESSCVPGCASCENSPSPREQPQNHEVGHGELVVRRASPRRKLQVVTPIPGSTELSSVGDFILQTVWQAMDKRGALTGSATARRALPSYVTTYTLAFVPALTWLSDSNGAAVFGIAALVAIPNLIQDDDQRLGAYARTVKKADLGNNPILPVALDQSFHLVALFLTALLAGS